MKQFTKFGINAMTVVKLPPVEHLEMIKGAGYDAFFNYWDNNTEVWANKAAQLGLIYTSIHAPSSREHHIWNGGEKGEAEMAKLHACLGDCARFDIPVMVLHTINGFDPNMPAAPTEVGLEAYAKLVEEANRLGVTLAFENTEREEFLAAVMERFKNEPCLGFCYDSGHEHCYRNSDMLTLYGDKLCHTHIDDNFGQTGEIVTWFDDSHLPPLDGSVDWKRVMNALDKTGFDGVLSLEMTMKNKPERSTHGAYTDMPPADYYALVLERAKRLASGQF
ncbi:MAG: sugar phosphate isomerase/epimerase [Clostridia bacterium]|nr:sugar phosphate isomerase/epimerase [Clostridia bacterium]